MVLGEHLEKLPCEIYGQRLATLEAYQTGFLRDLTELKVDIKEGFIGLSEQIKKQEARLYKISVIIALLMGGSGAGIGKYLL